MDAVNGGLGPVEALAALDEGTLAEWRDRLEAARYTPEVIGACESLLPMFPVEAMRRPLIERLLRKRGDPAALLARLWSYDFAVPAAGLEEVLGGRLRSTLTASGLLRPEGDGVASAFRVMPFEDLWLISDRLDAHPEAVMGPGGTTGEVARLLPARLGGDVLDLGCGAGTLALLAARRGARRVTGSDINPRAVTLARVNARLNRVSAEFVTGDLFAPHQGRRFATIVSQPPYVLLPPGVARSTAMHGGATGDAITARLLHALPSHLEEGGMALVLMDVPLGAGTPVHERFRALVPDAAVDVCAIVASGFPPDAQAAIYAMHEDPTIGARYAETVWRYRDHLEDQGVQGFRHVAVVLRRHAANAARDPITCELPVPGLPRSAGRAVDQVMAGLDLASASESVLLRSAVSPSPYARYEQVLRRPELVDDPMFRVRFEPGGLAVEQEMSAASLLLLEKLGTAPDVSTAAAAYEAEIEETPGAMQDAIVEFTRRGLATGLLVPRTATTNGAH